MIHIIIFFKNSSNNLKCRLKNILNEFFSQPVRTIFETKYHYYSCKLWILIFTYIPTYLERNRTRMSYIVSILQILSLAEHIWIVGFFSQINFHMFINPVQIQGADYAQNIGFWHAPIWFENVPPGLHIFSSWVQEVCIHNNQQLIVT